jgi:hypothetical protein
VGRGMDAPASLSPWPDTMTTVKIELLDLLIGGDCKGGGANIQFLDQFCFQ